MSKGQPKENRGDQAVASGRKLVPLCTFEGACSCRSEGEDVGAIEDCIYCPSLAWVEPTEPRPDEEQTGGEKTMAKSRQGFALRHFVS